MKTENVIGELHDKLTPQAEVIDVPVRPLPVSQPPAVRDISAQALFPAASPAERAKQMIEVAEVFVGLARQRDAEAKAAGRAPLIVEMIDKKTGRKSEHLTVPLWRTLGALLPRSVTATTVFTEQLRNGWKARAISKTLDNIELSAGEMVCTRDEFRWKDAPETAIISMAQTRAHGKALRGVLDFLVILAGFNPTPAEEMPKDTDEPPPPPAPPKPRRVRAKTEPEDPERQRVVSKIFALADEFERVGGTRGADFKATMHNDDDRHALVAKMFKGCNGLRDLNPEQLLQFVAKIETRIEEHSGS